MSFMEKSLMLQHLTNAMNSNKNSRLQEQRELEEMNKTDMNRPKKSRRKPKSERNTVSLNL